MAKLALGDIQIETIVELNEPFLPFAEFFPNYDAAELQPHLDWLVPRALSSGELRLMLPVQSYLVRTRHHTILIDTCIGCDKSTRAIPQWAGRRDEGWLRRLAAAGIAPEAVDYVFCSHLHVDHCGWNTRLVDGRWQPTFPNAKYVFAKPEYEASEAGNSSTFRENVLPIMEAGQAQLVDLDFALDDQVNLAPTVGHTAGHVAINLVSGGNRAAMSGDLIHSPLQCQFPDWCPRADADPVQAARTRRDFLARHCDTGTAILTAHFPLPSMGHIVPKGDAFFFEYLDLPD